MGRRKALTDDQVNEIFASPDVSSKELAAKFGVSYVTILKVRQGKGAYAVSEAPVEGTLVLDAHGEVVGLQPILVE